VEEISSETNSSAKFWTSKSSLMLGLNGA